MDGHTQVSTAPVVSVEYPLPRGGVKKRIPLRLYQFLHNNHTGMSPNKNGDWRGGSGSTVDYLNPRVLTASQPALEALPCARVEPRPGCVADRWLGALSAADPTQ